MYYVPVSVGELRWGAAACRGWRCFGPSEGNPLGTRSQEGWGCRSPTCQQARGLSRES